MLNSDLVWTVNNYCIIFLRGHTFFYCSNTSFSSLSIKPHFIYDNNAYDEYYVQNFHSIKRKCVYMWRLHIYIIPLLVFRFRYFWLSVTVGICFIKKVFFGPQDCCVQNDYDDVKGHSYPDRGQGQSLSPGGARSTTIHIPTIIITPRL